MPIIFDRSTGRFRDARGRFISNAQVHHEINKTVFKLENNLRLISKNLNNGKINLAQWQIQTSKLLKTAHLVTAAIGQGGRKQMTASEWGKAGVLIREQYKFLNNFARQIERGNLSANVIEFRASTYAKSIRESFYRTEIEIRKRAGFLYCRRILHSLETCPECADWAGRGFVPIEDQPPVGGLVCRSFCKCELEYSNKSE